METDIPQPQLLLPMAAKSPEHDLWANVFVLAIRDLEVAMDRWLAVEAQKECGQIRRRMIDVHDDALAWVESDAERLGSFVSLCGLFGLDPDVVRSRVLPRAELPAEVLADIPALYAGPNDPPRRVA